MQFGVCLPNFPFGVLPSRDAIVEVAQEADRLGYASIWASDHILVPRDKPRYGRVYESLTTLAYLGAVTRQVRLGISILVLPYRNAIIVAKQAATIDDLTGGRMIIGAGVGWIEGEFRALGADFADRGRRLDEGLAAMRALWTQDDPKFDGELYRFSDVLFAPRPARPGGIPIWVGGNSDAALRRAARLGDAWHADDLPRDKLAAAVVRLRELSRERTVAVTLRRTVDLRPAMSLPGAPGTIAVEGRSQPTGLGILAGSVFEVAAELDALRRIGVEHVVWQFEHRTQEEHVSQMRFFGQEILPRLEP